MSPRNSLPSPRLEKKGQEPPPGAPPHLPACPWVGLSRLTVTSLREQALLESGPGTEQRAQQGLTSRVRPGADRPPVLCASALPGSVHLLHHSFSLDSRQASCSRSRSNGLSAYRHVSLLGPRHQRLCPECPKVSGTQFAISMR